MKDNAAPPTALLETIANLASTHHEHEKFYSQAPLRQAADTQASSRVLKALAARWSEATPVELGRRIEVGRRAAFAGQVGAQRLG